MLEKIKSKKSFIIIGVIVILIVGVFIAKQFSGRIYGNVDDSNFSNNQDEVISKTYKIYNFGSEICPACEAMKPIYEKIKNEYKSILDFEYVDVNKNIKLSNTYDIEYTPTFIVVDLEGTEVDKLIGYVSEDKFREFVDKWGNK